MQTIASHSKPRQGIRHISRQTVRNILKEEGIEPAPDRTSDKWNQFLDRHKNTLWACDFFSVKAVTRRSHMVREHLPPVREKPEEVIAVDRDQVVVRSYVDGLVKSFERRAA